MGQLPPKLQAEIDSLQAVQSNQSDILMKAEVMAKIANKYQLFLPDTALGIGSEIVAMGEKSGNEEVRGIGLLTLGKLNVNGIGGSPQMAMDRISEAVQIFRRGTRKKDLSTGLALLGTLFGQFGQADSAMHYSLGSLREADAHGEVRDKVIALKIAGVTMMRIRKLEAADSLLLEMVTLAKEEGLSEELFRGYLIRGQVKEIQGNYLVAQGIYLAAVELGEGLQNKKWAGEAYVALTEPYIMMREFENARDYALKAVDNLEEVNATMNLILAYMAAGTSYMELEMADSSAWYLKKGLYSTPGSLHPFLRSAMLLHLSETSYMKGEWNPALAYADTAFEIASQMNNFNGIGLSHMKKAKVYLEQGISGKAVRHGKEALVLMERYSSPRDVMSASYLLYEAYKEQGNASIALEIHEDWADRKSKLITEENLRGYSKQEERHRYALQAAQDSVVAANEKRVLEAEAQAAIAETQQVDQRNFYLMLILAFVGVLGLGILLLFLQTRRQKGKIEAQKQVVDEAYSELSMRDEEKQTLLKEIHHRVKNNLQIVSSLLQLQAIELDDPDALAAVEDGQNRVKAMALIHEKLYQSENISQIDFEAYTHQLLQQIGTIYDGRHAVQSQVKTELATVDIETAIPLGLILTELVSNAYKYAFSDEIQGRIEIVLKDLGSDRYELQIKDNGPGLSENFDMDKNRSLGLRLVRNLARQLYGSVAYSFEDGAVFSVEFAGLEARKAVE